jgi:general secretion pathway protein A
MYEKFFNLKIKPFELIPNPDFIFLSRSHKKAMTYLDYGIRERKGFILLTGEVGSGKTTIIRNLIKGLNNNVKLSKVFNTKVSSEQLLAMINEDFGLNVDGKNKITLLRELNDFLIEQYSGNHQSILIIDEAQNLTSELLEEVRLLSNLETDRYKLLQIILVGQPELRNILSQPELRQLRQRISIFCHINALTRKETEEYIFHRLEIAGNREAITFHNETIDAIHNFSRGIPRLINTICDFLMISAFVEEKIELSIDLVKEVIGEIDLENRYWQDEAPEKYFSADENLIKEMVNRISRLEEEFFKKNVSQNEKAEIFERLSASENVLNRFIANTKTETITFNGTLKSVQNELIAFKDVIAQIESSSHATAEMSQRTAETKKTGFWRGIFQNFERNGG